MHGLYVCADTECIVETSALSLSAFSQRSQQRCEAMVTLSEVIHIATEVLARCGDGGGVGEGGGRGLKKRKSRMLPHGKQL